MCLACIWRALCLFVSSPKQTVEHDVHQWETIRLMVYSTWQLRSAFWCVRRS